VDRASEITALLACRFLQTKRIDDSSHYRKIKHFEKVRIAHICEYKGIALCYRLYMDRRYGFLSGLYLIVIICIAFATVSSSDVTDSLSYAKLTYKDTIMIDRRPQNISW